MANHNQEQIESAARPQTRTILRNVAIIWIVSATVAIFLWIVYKLAAVILLLVLAIFFAYLVAPLVDLVQRPIRIAGRKRTVPRALAIGVVYVALCLAIGLAIYLLVPQLAAQFPQFKREATAYYKTISSSSERLNGYFKQHRMPGSVVDAMNNTVLRLIEKGGEYTGRALEVMLGWLAYLPWLILIPILSFFLLKDADSFRRSALQMLPRGRWRWRGDEFFQDVNTTLATYIRAQLTACALIAVLSSVGFALIGLPSPLVLGFIAGAFEFFPLVGPLLIVILAALLAILHSGFGAALAVLVFLVVLRILQDYVIYPRIIGRGIDLHPLAVILAILAGAELAGVAGIFLAIPVIAILTVSYRHWLEHRAVEVSAEVPEEAAEASHTIRDSRVSAAAHPKTTTTPDEMARARPDLLTGELKLPKT